MRISSAHAILRIDTGTGGEIVAVSDWIVEEIERKRSSLVVGLDPHWDRIPAAFIRKRDGNVLRVLRDYCCEVMESCAAHVAAFKPQMAFFERFGAEGFAALEQTLALARTRGFLIILDGKRNDIGSTARAYASAFGPGTTREAPFFCHAVTVNAFLGWDGVEPFLAHGDLMLFVLVKTSNPSSGELQDLVLENGQTVSEALARRISRWNQCRVGCRGFGPVGAVVGATYPDHMRKLRALMPESLFLVPGFGAQGGASEAIKAAFLGAGRGALINSSRAILFPPDLDTHGMEAVERAAFRAKQTIQALTQQSQSSTESI